MKRFRTSIAAAMGGALLVAGLLVGASLALAQESDESEVTEAEEDTTGDSLTRVFGFVQDLLEDETGSAEPAAEDDLTRITEQLQDDLASLIDQIKERANSAIDDAVDSGSLTEEQAERARDRVEGFALPERFPFLDRGFQFGSDRFEFGPMKDWFELPEDFELPDGFLPEDFEFRFGPFERFGQDLEGFVEDLDIDLDELSELLESGMSLDEALQELGTDLESLLTDAREQARAKIDELVENGELSEEQADRIKEMLEGIELGDFPFGPGGFEFDHLPEDFEFRFGPFERFGQDLEGFVEDLDIDLDELSELLESGMSLDEALQELGTDLESLLTDAREQARAKIDELVENGELSEEQADRIKEMLEGIELGDFPSGLHRFGPDFGELPDLDRRGPGHGFFGPWDHHFDGEDLPAEETLLDV